MEAKFGSEFRVSWIEEMRNIMKMHTNKGMKERGEKCKRIKGRERKIYGKECKKEENYLGKNWKQRQEGGKRNER